MRPQWTGSGRITTSAKPSFQSSKFNLTHDWRFPFRLPANKLKSTDSRPNETTPSKER